MSDSSIRDNRNRGTVGKFLKDNIKPNAELSIVSAYFTIYAYEKLKPQLDGIKQLRFLFGEPTFIKSIDPSKTNKRDFKIEGEEITIGEAIVQKALAKDCADWIRNKVSIKSMVKPNFLHGKSYLIENTNGNNEAIIGSSNFTVSGLGLGSSSNIELNMVVQHKGDAQELKNWFDELWNDNTELVEDVKENVLKYLEQLYIENQPEFIYLKTLYHLFENYLNEQDKGGLLNEKTGFLQTEIWKDFLYQFQKDGVTGAINKLLKYNGCVIADSVGLGKTFEALAVIRYFELLNYRVLVICPKKLADNWNVYRAEQNSVLNPFKKDRFNYTVLYHTDLGRSKGMSNGIELSNFNWANYDLVVIDESHNLKGNPMAKINKEGEEKMNRPMWLMEEIIKKGVNTKVLLLSATPVNNSLIDLRNQLLFITKGDDNALQTEQINDISQILKNAQTKFNDWSDPTKTPNRTVKLLMEKLDSSFIKLLDTLTIARSRKHITSFYKNEMETIGAFPVRLKPLSIYPDIDTLGEFPAYDTINAMILKYKLAVFNPSAYVTAKYKSHYEAINGRKIKNFTQLTREHFLIGMMKVNFLKRLESSIAAFEVSMQKTIAKITQLEDKIALFIANGTKSQTETLEQLQPDETEQDENPDDIDQWLVGKKLKFDLAHLNLNEWLNDLKTDKKALQKLADIAKLVQPQRDAKLQTLKNIIIQKVQNPANPNNKKIIVFTAFADTAKYLYDNLKHWANNTLQLHIAMVAGGNTYTSLGKNDFGNILSNFSPIAKKRNQNTQITEQKQIDILIATDCISEGQNLQDADYLVNYDIHWNPVRIIQRFGRIDRLGSKNTTIQLVNFWPTKDLDNYLNLKTRVEARMALVDLTASNEDNLLEDKTNKDPNNAIKDMIEDDLKYRYKQLKKLQEEVLDIEDLEDNLDLTDFSLQDFRAELQQFFDQNKQKLKDAPLGLYAIVPAPNNPQIAKQTRIFTDMEQNIIQPGVIFCLRQKGENKENQRVNLLHPYLLVYIYNNGEVKYNYDNAKQILEVFRLLCQNQKPVYETLCDLFNQQTQHGKNMEQYTNLLKKAAKDVYQHFNKRNAQQVLANSSGLFAIQNKPLSQLENFELITWLIIN